MNENVRIINRYFAAIQQLKTDKIIRGLRTITERYGLNRWNLITLRNSTTAIYIERDQRKVDEANRRVIDWVLYGKR